jgi:lysozyme family protein
MTTVDEILEEVLVKEGWPAYTEHPNDRGGPTKGGITLRALEAWKGKRCTRRELKLFTREKALQLLRQRYVNTHGIDLVVAEGIGAQLVDNSVLSGPALAVKDLQGVLGVPADGILGKQTWEAYGRLDPRVVGNRLAVARALRLARHVKKHPDQLVFLSGWMVRCLSFIE